MMRRRRYTTVMLAASPLISYRGPLRAPPRSVVLPTINTEYAMPPELLISEHSVMH